ncbi:hypothetical protein KP509_29G041400 [Ceratopteris richardii]|uniref:Uncharacterized protein n=1 Tax=Ceratopteris richardii TaxID=49495 RepID=A0A8T2R7J2_CERRI|nr:hypothetical protein KP509_29G041400 [Ceratopteris richardii]
MLRDTEDRNSNGAESHEYRVCKHSPREPRAARLLKKCLSIGSTYSSSTPYYTISNQNSHSAVVDHCSRRRNPAISNSSDVLNVRSYDHEKKSENQNRMRRSATISASCFHASSYKSKNSLAAYCTQRREDLHYSARQTFLPYRTSIVALS